MSGMATEVKTSDGRVLGLRQLTPADTLDLIEAAGQASSSVAWMRYASMICSVSSIDGIPVMMPATKQALRELGRRIGNAGIDALYETHYPEADEAQLM